MHQQQMHCVSYHADKRINDLMVMMFSQLKLHRYKLISPVYANLQQVN